MFERLKKMRTRIIFRVTAAFLLCIFLPILLFLIFGYMRIGDMIKEENLQGIHDSLLDFEQEFHRQIYHYDDVIDSIAKSGDIIQYIENSNDLYYENSVREYIDEYTADADSVYKDIEFFTYSNKEFSLKNFSNVGAVENENWYIDFFASQSSEHWYSDFSGDKHRIIKLIKLYDRDQKELGVMRVSMDLDKLAYAVVYNFKEKDTLFVTTPDGEEVYFSHTSGCFDDFNSKKGSFASAILKMREDVEDTFVFERTTVTMKRLSDYRIIIGSAVDNDKQPESFTAVKLSIFFTIFILIIFAAIFYYYIFKIFTTLRRDISLVEDYVENNPSGRLAVKYNNEIGDIERQYNILLGNIEKLTKNIVLKERLRKNAEISMLQSQLNPHFIYNVINHFRMQAEINEDYDMADSIAKFGKLMRYYMVTRDYMITLKEELVNLKYFLELEMLRFTNQIEFEIDCQKGIDGVKVPKCILQPIIENSIKYGKRQGNILKIDILIREENGDIRIVIRDNGRGVDEFTLQSLNAQFRSGYYIAGAETEVSTKIGLKNINQRIRLIYNDEYHLSVNSVENEFFEVTIRIPAEW